MEKDRAENIVIAMDKSVYHTREGSEAAFLDCTVEPLPESIVWKSDKSVRPTKTVLNNNRKFYYSPTSPTLVIRDPNKANDEANYQCTAKANGKSVDGEIVQLQFAVVKTKLDEPSTNITGTSEDFPNRGQLSASAFELNQQKQDKENQSTEHTGRSYSDTRTRGQKRSSSTTCLSGKRATVGHIDQGCRMSFLVNNDIDITRKESESDISDAFAKVTRQKGRVMQANLTKKCIQVCIYITAARNLSEPSSVHLAEEFKNYLLDGKIQLTDELCTVLDVEKDSFQITPQNIPQDGLPYVDISHGEFAVPVGRTAIIQTYVIASKEVKSIQWFKLEDDDHIPIEIDNKIYFGGSVLSPTLIICETNIDDQGQYMCSATNVNGTGWSDISVLSVPSGETGALKDTPIKQNIVSETKLLSEWRSPCDITCVCPTTDGQVWTGCYYTYTLTLLDMAGKEMQKVNHNTEIMDISISPLTNTLWACDLENNIKELVSGRLEHRFSTKEEPLCICIPASDHVIVGMARQLTKFTVKGQVVLTTSATRTGKASVGSPHKISECPVTHNIAVVDLYHMHGGGKGKACVFVMNTDFKKLFMFDGDISEIYQHTSPSRGRQFYPRSVAYDSVGNLVIGDRNNSSVLLVSGRGEFLRILHIDNGYMHAVGIDRCDVLRVVSDWTHVKILQYVKSHTN
ncbi:uncharacterized protein LOC117333630 [Pecten maximus]|uniref:uncharacterized protein LOC117333630 n=1 Tax=Pecten maximus TaxID=6579 RepID=UPI001458DF04|nr:uncharacterized protein LOC117333630 [Pecten maximus]